MLLFIFEKYSLDRESTNIVLIQKGRDFLYDSSNDSTMLKLGRCMAKMNIQNFVNQTLYIQ